MLGTLLCHFHNIIFIFFHSVLFLSVWKWKSTRNFEKQKVFRFDRQIDRSIGLWHTGPRCVRAQMFTTPEKWALSLSSCYQSEKACGAELMGKICTHGIHYPHKCYQSLPTGPSP